MKWYPDEQLALPHENLDLYAPGGFHPVDIGDTFSDGRYTIHHKLGYGGFSTVWLARDSSEGHVAFSCFPVFDSEITYSQEMGLP